MSNTKKQYGVQNKYDANDTEWYNSGAEADVALEEANTFFLVEREEEPNHETAR